MRVARLVEPDAAQAGVLPDALGPLVDAARRERQRGRAAEHEAVDAVRVAAVLGEDDVQVAVIGTVRQPARLLGSISPSYGSQPLSTVIVRASRSTFSHSTAYSSPLRRPGLERRRPQRPLRERQCGDELLGDLGPLDPVALAADGRQHHALRRVAMTLAERHGLPVQRPERVHRVADRGRVDALGLLAPHEPLRVGGADVGEPGRSECRDDPQPQTLLVVADRARLVAVAGAGAGHARLRRDDERQPRHGESCRRGRR